MSLKITHVLVRHEGTLKLRKAQQLGMFGGGASTTVKQHTAANPGGGGTHVVHEYQRQDKAGRTWETEGQGAKRTAHVDAIKAAVHALNTAATAPAAMAARAELSKLIRAPMVSGKFTLPNSKLERSFVKAMAAWGVTNPDAAAVAAPLRKGRRLGVRLSCLAPECVEADGYGGFTIRPVRPMAKGRTGVDLHERPAEPVVDTFAVDGITCTLRKASTGVCTLTLEGSGLPLPFHMIVRGATEARERAPGVVRELRAGRTPMEGVYRRHDVPVARYRARAR